MVEVSAGGTFQGSQRTCVMIGIAALLGFVIETQMTQYVQTTLGYRQSFFLFYMAHSAFTFIFPLHLLFIAVGTKHKLGPTTEELWTTLQNHLGLSNSSNRRRLNNRFLALISFMLAGVTIPGLLWFAAIPLAPISDVTALWNANAFFAYVFSVVLLGVPVDTRKLGAVLIATAGVLAVVYGGSQSSEATEDEATTEDSPHSAAPLLGNVLTLIASMTYGLYQVLYKKYAALSLDNSSIPTHNGLYQAVADDVDAGEANRTHDRQSTLPFGLFPNFLTGSVGLATIIVLGIFIPILDFLGIEEFRAIPDVRTAASIAVIAISGMVFNSGYMILLSVWGPVVTSIGGLTTIVLAFISDALFGAGLDAVTIWSLTGSSVIVAAFGMLVHDMLRTR